MKRNLLCTLLASAHFAVGQSPYSALQVPKQIQYQGRVATSTGVAWSGAEGYFSFALVQGATVLWNNWEGTASPSDPETVSLGAGQVITLPVNQGVFSLRLGEGSDINEQIPPTVFFDTVSNSVRSGVKLAVWFSADGGTFTRLSPDVDFTSVPYAMVAGIAETVKERAVTSGMLGEDAVQSINIASGAVGIGQIANNAVTSASIADGAIALADLSSEAISFGAPKGMIVAYGGESDPPGWLICDGRAVLRQGQYAGLFDAIGVRYGGDGSTFNIPNARGMVLRGTGSRTVNGRTKVGPVLGGIQEDHFQGHWHRARTENGPSGGSLRFSFESGGTDVIGESDLGFAIDAISDGANGTPRVGQETRVSSLGVNYIIKY